MKSIENRQLSEISKNNWQTLNLNPTVGLKISKLN